MTLCYRFVLMQIIPTHCTMFTTDQKLQAYFVNICYHEYIDILFKFYDFYYKF